MFAGNPYLNASYHGSSARHISAAAVRKLLLSERLPLVTDIAVSVLGSLSHI